jgi:ribosomal protein L13E
VLVSHISTLRRGDMVKIDTEKLTPEERKAVLKQLEEEQQKYEKENILKVKEEFQKMAQERGFTLGQLNLAGQAPRKGRKLGPRKKNQDESP